MILRDFHVHSTYCDGRCELEEIINTAIEKGVKTLGIVSHCYTPFHVYGRLTPDSVYEFSKELNALKARYSDKIELLVGVEEDYFGETDLSKFDYVIGDVHYIKGPSKYHSIDYVYPEFKALVEDVGGGVNAYKIYYEQLVKLVKEKNPHIVGHFDIISKNNNDNEFFDEESEDYIATWKKAIDEILAFNKDIYFEVNTGGIARKYKDRPYPRKEMVEYIKSKNGKLLLTSDAHHKDNLCFEFEKWKKEFDL
ncbi:MAG: histidinol-phosphatase HisJ family protein [Clostridia bacterium]|nr:histidinol-phosphatase HisJ family protein [Clostridia bacterium]